MKLRLLLLPVFTAIFASGARSAPPDLSAPGLKADEIMKRVAANQDREQKERAQYLYDQHVKVVIRRTNGKLAREETTDLVV